FAERRERQLRDQSAHLLDDDVVRVFERRDARHVRMLVGRDPATVLAFAAGCTLRLAAVDQPRDPAREFGTAGAGIFVNENAMRESTAGERGAYFALRFAEPGRIRRRAHRMASGARPTASTSAATADWH